MNKLTASHLLECEKKQKAYCNKPIYNYKKRKSKMITLFFKSIMNHLPPKENTLIKKQVQPAIND